jgi:glyoxylase-like metal-dependent hydrolase (beta-lactamase superfamily II)
MVSPRVKKSLRLGAIELHWLNGGIFELDGGTAFGPVPKILWEKKAPSDAENYLPISAYPILIKTPDTLLLLESGLGNKLTEKQRKLFRIKAEWEILQDLSVLGLQPNDIEYVILTHYDWDHSAGVVMQEGADLKLTFPCARHVIQKTEWDDVLNANARSMHTYWPINIETLKNSSNLVLKDGDAEIVNGISVSLTGGHTRGHQIVMLESEGQKAIYLGDLLPTHAHFNPLWITAYDNFPLDSIRMKEQYITQYVAENAWFLFYQDPKYLACKFDAEGKVLEAIKA